MLKRYLVAHEDSITMWAPAFVTSGSPDAAIAKYLKQVYSKDSVFREHVQDLSYVDGFTGGLVYHTLAEKDAFIDGVRLTSPALLRQRIKDFFSLSPELGKIFLHYIDTEDISVINDAVYEYIAMKDPDGIVAIEEEEILTLA